MAPEIYSSFGYDENYVSFALSGSLILGLPISVTYSKYCMKYPDQLLKIERLIILATICAISLPFMLYYNVHMYVTFVPMVVSIVIFLLSTVVITEETIKHCSLIVPDSTLYSTGTLGIGRIFIAIPINSVLGKFYDSPIREYHLLGSLILGL